MYLISCTSLAILSALCAAGLLSKHFKDNLFQNVGMSVLMIASASRVVDIWRAETVPWDWAGLHVSMMLYAVGTAWKCYAHTIAESIARARGWRPNDIEIRPWQEAVALIHPDRRRKPR